MITAFVAWLNAHYKTEFDGLFVGTVIVDVFIVWNIFG